MINHISNWEIQLQWDIISHSLAKILKSDLSKFWQEVWNNQYSMLVGC